MPARKYIATSWSTRSRRGRSDHRRTDEPDDQHHREGADGPLGRAENVDSGHDPRPGQIHDEPAPRQQQQERDEVEHALDEDRRDADLERHAVAGEHGRAGELAEPER
jgi:hypothetical protein